MYVLYQKGGDAIINRCLVGDLDLWASKSGSARLIELYNTCSKTRRSGDSTIYQGRLFVVPRSDKSEADRLMGLKISQRLLRASLVQYTAGEEP